MKIFASCLVKNEADMIEETLRSASQWCDRIFVFDNGSTDETWDKVLLLAKELPQMVVPYKSASVPFRNSLRMEVFEHFRHEANGNDWWCILDADEIYIDNVREFLGAVPKHHQVVWGVYFQHYFTDVDVIRWNADRSCYPPYCNAEKALRYYRCDYSEVRFFRYRKKLIWKHGSAPRHLGVVHPRRIRFKHYQYRSPEQIQLRLETRQQAIKEGCENFSEYCSEVMWREKVVPASSCLCIDSAPFRIEEDKIPPHMESPMVRIVKLLLHMTGVWA